MLFQKVAKRDKWNIFDYLSFGMLSIISGGKVVYKLYIGEKFNYAKIINSI